MTMNVVNIPQNIPTGVYVPKFVPAETQPVLKGEKVPEIPKSMDPAQHIPLPGSQKTEKEKEAEKKSREELLMKPSPLTLEERMEQVISAEQVKDLLSLVTRFPLQEPEEIHSLDVKR